MKTCLACVWFLAIASGCKTDPPAPASGIGSAQPTAGHAGVAPRSGKIDLPPRRPTLPSGADDADPRAGSADGSSWTGRRRSALDLDHDGVVSPEERAVGLGQRAESMHARLDADGDGKLTPAELADSRMGRRIADLAAVDTDKDGDISPDELAKALETVRGQWRGPRGSGALGADAVPAPDQPPATPRPR